MFGDNRRIYTFLLLGILLLAFVLRFFRLGEVPYGLYQDETSIGYNAYSLLETGKDEYGKNFPLYFKSFGDQKLPVYVYLTAGSVAVFGLNEFAVRFPSALFGFLTVAVLFFFIRDLTKNDRLALLAAFLLAINPWSLHYNRATFEVSVALFLFLTGSYLIYLFFQKKKKGAFLLATVFFVLALYSYNLTRLLAPLLFILTIYFFSKGVKARGRKEFIASLFLLVGMLMPFLYTFTTPGGFGSAKGTLITSSNVVQAPLIEFRSYVLGLPDPLSSLFYNKWVLTGFVYLKHILSYFSSDFYFISGSSHGNHGIGNVGQFYIFEFPFLLLGLIVSLSKKIKWMIYFGGWALLVMLVASLTREAPHATRSFFLVVPLTLLVAIGADEFLRYIKSLQKSYLRYGLTLFIAAIAVFNIAFYFSSYYIRFPVFYASSWRAADKELVGYIASQEKKYDKIIVDPKAGLVYSSVLFYSQFQPEEFQKTVKRLPDDKEGFSYVTSFGKYEFREIDWGKDYPGNKTLYITIPEAKPDAVPPLKAIYYPERPVVFSVKEEIVQYPVREIPYVVVVSP